MDWDQGRKKKKALHHYAKELFWNCTCLTVADEVGLKNSNIRTNEGTNLHKLSIFWEAAKLACFFLILVTGHFFF